MIAQEYLMFAAFFTMLTLKTMPLLPLDRFSYNSIGRGKRPGGTCPWGNVLQPATNWPLGLTIKLPFQSQLRY